MPIYRVPFNCYAIDIKDTASRFNPDVYLWLLSVIYWPKTGRILAYYQYSGLFLGKNCVFDQLGCPFVGFLPTVNAIYIKDIASRFDLNVFLWLLCIIQWPKLGGFLHNINICCLFGFKLGYLPPGVHLYSFKSQKKTSEIIFLTQT